MKVTEEILYELGFVKQPNKWVHQIKGADTGLFIYDNKLPETLAPLVKIMTGTAFKKGYNKAISEKQND